MNVLEAAVICCVLPELLPVLLVTRAAPSLAKRTSTPASGPAPYMLSKANLQHLSLLAHCRYFSCALCLPKCSACLCCRWGAVLYTLGCVMYIIACAFDIALDFTSVHISDTGEVGPKICLCTCTGPLNFQGHSSHSLSGIASAMPAMTISPMWAQSTDLSGDEATMHDTR